MSVSKTKYFVVCFMKRVVAFPRESRCLVQLNSLYGKKVSYLSKSIDLAQSRNFLCNHYVVVNVGMLHDNNFELLLYAVDSI